MNDYKFEDFEKYAEEVEQICKAMDWRKDWSRGGCYIHLEASEFIEALRGKGDPVEELGDLLFTIIAIADYYNIDPLEGILKNLKKQRKLVKNVRNKE